ncbi:MAG: proton-conducting transporter membrane subunit, partial [Rikenellaceae bacterium]
MMLINFLIISLVVVLFMALSRSRSLVKNFGAIFYAIQIAFAVWIAVLHPGDTDTTFFTFDRLGVLFYCLMVVISTIVFYHIDGYLDKENLREYKYFNISFILLCISLAGVYFANNILVTWIFLEATTIATAGLVYHRRTTRSLEATWKYIFICSVGIAIAYLGILFMSNIVGSSANLSYNNIALHIADANPM